MSYRKLLQKWHRLRFSRALERNLIISDEGIVLGATGLAKLEDGRLHIDEARVTALLSIAYCQFVPQYIISHIRRAEKAYVRGDKLLALTHLALTGLHAIDGSETPVRLFQADWLMRVGVSPDEVLKSAGLARAYNPDEPRDDQGRWTSEGEDASSDAADTKPAAPDSWGNPDTLQRHIEDHASDFGIDPESTDAAEQYAQKANQFLQAWQEEGIQMKIEPEGYTRVYDPETNTFGSYNPDGTTRTFYNPPRGQSYFDAQPGTLYVGGQQVNTTPTSEVTIPESMGGDGGGGSGIRPEGIYHNDPFLNSEEKDPID